MVNVIARDRWAAFLQNFSERHYGWLVSMEGAHAGEHTPLPLDALALTLDRKREILAITLTDPDRPQGHRQVAVDSPSGVMSDEDEGQDHILLIDSPRGRIRLRFARSPAIRHAVQQDVETGRRLRRQ